MIIEQKLLTLKPKARGFHIITDEITAQLPNLSVISEGILHLFLQHTSASLSLNENADPTVRSDLESFFNKTVPENEPYYQHTYEGPDDLPAHIKSALLGVSLSLPVQQGHLALGTWQGIILGEHRNQGGARHILTTLHGTANNDGH